MQIIYLYVLVLNPTFQQIMLHFGNALIASVLMAAVGINNAFTLAISLPVSLKKQSLIVSVSNPADVNNTFIYQIILSVPENLFPHR